MADIYLHSRLAEKVIDTLDYDFNKSVVFTAAQGPDPLYYLFLDKEGKEYRYYADRMHDTNTRMLLTHMTQYVKKHNNKDTYSFLVGFLCHYALDVKIHPYVYYNVGLYDKKDPSTHQYRGLHMKFERSIDAVMIQQDEKMKAHKYRLTKKYFPLKQVPEDVENILGYALKQTYGKDNGNEMYRNGVKTMHFNVKHIITDRFGIKKKAYQLLDLFNKETDMFYQDLSFYKHIEEYDYLNDKHESWNHPITNEAYNYSVIDLYDQAYLFALELIREVDKYIHKDKQVDLSTVFTNLSFNSGIACDHHDKMKYFNNYRK